MPVENVLASGLSALSFGSYMCVVFKDANLKFC